jgi:hypothetical protein
LGDKTGAYGVRPRGRPRKGGKVEKSDHREVRQLAFTPYFEPDYRPYDKYQLDANYSPMMGPQHPAMWPTVPNLPDIGGAVRKQPRAPVMAAHHRKGRGNRGFGGSFRPA